MSPGRLRNTPRPEDDGSTAVAAKLLSRNICGSNKDSKVPAATKKNVACTAGEARLREASDSEVKLRLEKGDA